MSDDVSVGTIEVDPQSGFPNPLKEDLENVLALLEEPPHHRPPQLETSKKLLKEIIQDL